MLEPAIIDNFGYIPVDYTNEIVAMINDLKRNQNRTQYSYKLYDTSKIKFDKFNFRYKDPMNIDDLIPRDLDQIACGKSYSADSNLSTVLTQLARYSKSNNIECDPTWKLYTKPLQQMFKQRFLHREPTKVNNFQLTKTVNAVITKMEKNGGLFKDLNLALAPLNETFTIHFFLKTIQKVVMPKALDADKAGQGISAWSKVLNAVFCPIFRSIEENFRNDLRSTVIYDNGIPEAELDARVAALWDHDARIFTSDCKEFDANQDASTQFLEDCFIDMYLPLWFTQIYREMRLKSKQKSLFVTLEKEAVKDSGESATLLMNTVVKMWHTLLVTDVQGVKLEAYKGDDSIINADVIVMTNKLVRIDESLHLPIIADMDYPLHGDMAGWFYSEFGIIPDILKIVGKFLSKEYEKKKNQQIEQWERRRLGVEGLPYFDQVKISMLDKKKFLNEKKLIYLKRIYSDLYSISSEQFTWLISYFLWCGSDACDYRRFNIQNAIYWADLGYQRLDLSEADKNRKRVIQHYEDVEDIRI